MENIGKALIIAVQYLGAERNDEEYLKEDDLKIVEYAATLVQEATEEEKQLLVKLSKEMGLHEWASHIGIE